MIGRVLFAAILAGIAAGVVMSAVQMWQVTPLIAQAEIYESGAHGHEHDHSHAPAEGAADHAHAHTHEWDIDQAQSGDDGHGHDAAHAHDHAHAGWMPSDGAERTAFTVLANLVVGAGFGLVMAAAALLAGRAITPANGWIWGMIGFFVFAVAPAAGLPPELPGMAAADLTARQVWWITAVVGMAGGIAALALFPGLPAKAVGVALIAIPHLVGAPVAPEAESAVPPGLAAEFVAVSLATAALFWVVLGVTMGWLMQRGAEREEVAA